MPEITRRHRKPVAMLVDTVAWAKSWIDAFVQIIADSSDVAVLRTAHGSAVRAVRL
jgi:hypothetical protein